MPQIRAVALDAMGVIYTVADDLRDLLIPYLRSQGCVVPDERLVELYRACYREGAPAKALWDETGCDWQDGRLEDDFIARYDLVPGVLEFLQAMDIPVFLLSNDVLEWSIKKRQHFGIDAYLAGCVISGEQKVAKPSPLISQGFRSLAEGINRFREQGGKRAVVASLLIDLTAPDHRLPDDEPFNLFCPPRDAADRLQRLAELGFNDALLIKADYRHQGDLYGTDRRTNLYGSDISEPDLQSFRALVPKA